MTVAFARTSFSARRTTAATEGKSTRRSTNRVHVGSVDLARSRLYGRTYGGACNPGCQTGCSCGWCGVVGGASQCLTGTAGPKDVGEVCNPNSDPNDPMACKAGLYCQPECSDTTGRCYRYCPSTNDSTVCGTGSSCNVTLRKLGGGLPTAGYPCSAASRRPVRLFRRAGAWTASVVTRSGPLKTSAIVRARRPLAIPALPRRCANQATFASAARPGARTVTKRAT